jgi:Icc protein
MLLKDLDVPVLTLPGNHDRPMRQKKHFPMTTIEEPYLHEQSDWQIILLNSAVENEIPGTLKPGMISGLERLLSDTATPKLIILHHQPVPTGSTWIDRYGLLQPQKFLSLLQGRGDVKAVLWGHIHHNFSTWHGETRLLGSPSTSANSLAQQDKFTFDTAGPACRWLKLGGGSQFETGILYSEPGLIPEEARSRE